MRRLRGVLVGFGAMVILSTMLASPAAAATYKPDGWVRYYRYNSPFSNIVDPSPWKGQNVYNATANHQKSQQNTSGVYDPASFYEFEVTIQNDGSADRFKVRATGSGATAKYLRGSTNITNAVVAGTYTTPQLAAGATLIIKVRMSIHTGQRLITITSVGDPSRKDAVKVKVTLSDCGC